MSSYECNLEDAYLRKYFQYTKKKKLIWSVIIKHALLNMRSTLKSYLHFKISNTHTYDSFQKIRL